MSEDNQEITPEEALNRIINSKLMDTCVSMPATITSYDSATQLAQVQPIFKQVFVNFDNEEKKQDVPVINEVPVMFPQNADFFIHITPQPGDICLLIFSDKSLDSYIASDGKSTLDPIESRQHNINDCVAWVGFGTQKTKINNTDPNAIMIAKKDGSAEFKITNTNELTFKGTSAKFGEHTASEALALASKVDSAIQRVENAVNSHIHVGNLGAPTSPATPPVIFIPPTDTKNNTVFVRD